MAIQFSKTFDNGVVAPECYAKIHIVEYIPAVGTVCFLTLYYDKAARDANLNAIKEVRYELPEQESRADIYVYLKTLPDFVEAINV
jgi:hypothetical protein